MLVSIRSQLFALCLGLSASVGCDTDKTAEGKDKAADPDKDDDEDKGKATNEAIDDAKDDAEDEVKGKTEENEDKGSAKLLLGKDKVEGLIRSVKGVARGSWDLLVVERAAVGGGDSQKRGIETGTDLVRDSQSGRKHAPELRWGKLIGNAVEVAPVRLNHFSRGNMPQF